MAEVELGGRSFTEKMNAESESPEFPLLGPVLVIGGCGYVFDQPFLDPTIVWMNTYSTQIPRLKSRQDSS